MTVLVHACAHPELDPFRMPDRFFHEVAYFMTLPGNSDGPQLSPGEYWVRRQDAQTILDDGVVRIVSPLDSQSRAEIELSEEQEAWLEWMVKHRIEHIRLQSAP